MKVEKEEEKPHELEDEEKIESANYEISNTLMPNADELKFVY